MLRLITCQHATLMLEKRAGHALPQGVRASLWLHLRYCAYCNRYAKQTMQIAEWARASAGGQVGAGTGLSHEAKQRMREQLRATG